VGFCIVEVVSSMEKCLKRNSRRPSIDRVKESTLILMKHQFVSPSEDPQSWEKHVIRLSDDVDIGIDVGDESKPTIASDADGNIDAWTRLIFCALEDPPTRFDQTGERDEELMRMEHDRIRSCSLHQLDLGLRTICGNTMKRVVNTGNQSEDEGATRKKKLKQLGKTLNLMKKMTFETFKRSASIEGQCDDDDGDMEEPDISFILDTFESNVADEVEKVSST
jgi:hypothetical protein